MLSGQNAFLCRLCLVYQPVCVVCCTSCQCYLPVWGFPVPLQSVSTSLLGHLHYHVPATKREWRCVWPVFPSKLYLPSLVLSVWVYNVVSGRRYHRRRELRWGQPRPWHSCSQIISAIWGKSGDKQTVECPATKRPGHSVVDLRTRPDHRWQLASCASQLYHSSLHLSPWCSSLRRTVPEYGFSRPRAEEGWPASSTADPAGCGSACGMPGLDPPKWGDYRDGRPDFSILCIVVRISRWHRWCQAALRWRHSYATRAHPTAYGMGMLPPLQGQAPALSEHVYRPTGPDCYRQGPLVPDGMINAIVNAIKQRHEAGEAFRPASPTCHNRDRAQRQSNYHPEERKRPHEGAQRGRYHSQPFRFQPCGANPHCLQPPEKPNGK